MDRSPTIKVDLPSCTLIVTLSLEQEVGIRILQHEKESSNRNQNKNPVKESSKKKKQKQNPECIWRIFLSWRGSSTNRL